MDHKCLGKLTHLLNKLSLAHTLLGCSDMFLNAFQNLNIYFEDLFLVLIAKST